MADGPRVSKRELNILFFHFILFFLLPYIPREIIVLSDMLVVRIALLAILIYSAYISPLIAITTFIVIALLFVERNKIKMNRLQAAMSQSTPESPAIAEIQSPETAPEQPAFLQPEVDSYPFMPQDDSGDDSFFPVAESLNEKQPLPTEPSNDGSQKAIDVLYKWVNPNMVQEA
jgi:hypothetical protein